MFSFVVSGEVGVGSNGTSSKSITNMKMLNKWRYTPIKRKSSLDDSSSSRKPLLEVKDEREIERSRGGFDSKGSSVRVKVKMTKQEAARLLSKCKDGGVLEFRDVAAELVNLPVNRVNVVNPYSMAEYSG
ncbi:hypothetical protein V6N13_147778 [Hibiscus sabdariffa]|uniref:DUF7890 domain-containing protein n=1 Tax=Hibiscus sabdariffa TaxID=183260 RepID=A0ABR2TWT9_9ROSI